MDGAREELTSGAEDLQDSGMCEETLHSGRRASAGGQNSSSLSSAVHHNVFLVDFDRDQDHGRGGATSGVLVGRRQCVTRALQGRAVAEV